MIGGRDDKQVLKSVERLDCMQETWSYVRAIPKKTYDHAAAVLAGKVRLLYILVKRNTRKLHSSAQHVTT